MSLRHPKSDLTVLDLTGLDPRAVDRLLIEMGVKLVPVPKDPPIGLYQQLPSSYWDESGTGQNE